MTRRLLHFLVTTLFLFQQGACCCGSVSEHSWISALSFVVGLTQGDGEVACDVASVDRGACGCSAHGSASGVGSGRCGESASSKGSSDSGATHCGCTDCGESPDGHRHHLCLGSHLLAVSPDSVATPLADLLGCCHWLFAFPPASAHDELVTSLLRQSSLRSAPISCLSLQPSLAMLQVFRF